MSTPKANNSARVTSRDANSPRTTGGTQLTLTPATVHAQVAAGAELNVTSGLTIPGANGNVGYTIRITLGAGGVPVVYTVSGTYCGLDVTEDITFTAAGAMDSTQPFSSVTSITTDVDPEGTSDFVTLDAHFPKAPRGVWVGGAGVLSCRLEEDDSDTLYSGVPAGTFLNIQPSLIRCDLSGRSGITLSSATLVTVAR